MQGTEQATQEQLEPGQPGGPLDVDPFGDDAAERPAAPVAAGPGKVTFHPSCVVDGDEVRGTMVARVGAVTIARQTGNWSSQVTRRRLAKAVAGNRVPVPEEPAVGEAKDDFAKRKREAIAERGRLESDLEGYLLAAVDWLVSERAADLARAEEAERLAAATADPFTPTPRARRTAADYVLVPGLHATDLGDDIERGADGFTDEVVDRLPAGALYRRVRPGQIVGDPGAKTFNIIEPDAARIVVDGAMRLGKWVLRGGGESERRELVYLSCARDHVGLVLARALTDARVPELKSLTSYPSFTSAFRLTEPGFRDGLYYDEPPELAGLAPVTDLAEIRRTLDDLLVDFPFKDESDRQNYIGLLLTPAVRQAIDANVPGTLIHASLERTGKTKLAEVWGFVWTGKRTPAMQVAESNEEMDKRITAKLIAGATMLHLDNLKEWVDLPSLASLLTATVYEGRLLGVSKTVEVPNNLTIVATGNNVKMTGEMAKRMVPVRLQPRTDAPELRRDFVHPDLWDYVRGQRRHVLACLLGMVELWVRAGRPRGRKPMGGFDEWAACVGGVMAAAGYGQWLDNAAEWRDDADTRRNDLRALVDEWDRLNNGGPLTAKEILAMAERLELFPEVLGGKEGRAALTSFGMRVLARNVDTPVGPWVIHRNSLSHPAIYALRALPDATDG